MQIERRFLLLISAVLIVDSPALADTTDFTHQAIAPPILESLPSVSAFFAETWPNSMGTISSLTFGSETTGITLFTDTVACGTQCSQQEQATGFIGSDFLYNPALGIEKTYLNTSTYYSIGWDWTSFPFFDGMRINFADGNTLSESGPLGFETFISDTPIASLEISNVVFPVVFVDWAVSPPEVPEPKYVGLLLGAVLILLTVRHRVAVKGKWRNEADRA